MGIIYLAVNSVNGKMYIGQTVQALQSRISEHVTDSNHRRRTVFSRAIAKYGIEYFTFSVLETCEVSELNVQERFWIAVYDSRKPFGYNVSSGGGGVPGLKGPDNPNYGKRWTHSPEIIQKMIEIQNRPELKEANRLRAHLYNPLCDPDTRPKALVQLKAAATSQWADPEQRKKKLEGIRRAWQNPEIRAKRLAVPNSGKFKKRSEIVCAQ